MNEIQILEEISNNNNLMFALLFLLNIIDYLTGSWKARILKIENSKEGLKGVINKMIEWVILLISFIIPYLFTALGNLISIDFTISSSIIWFVLISLIINEIRSILENLIESGIEVPLILSKGLEVLNNNLNNIDINEEKNKK